MARSYGVIGIDCGTESVKAAFLEVVKGEEFPRVVGVASSPSRGMRKGVVLEPDQMSVAIKETLNTLMVKKGDTRSSLDFYVGIGGIGLGYQKVKGLVAISRADGEVSLEDIRRTIAASEANCSRIQNREILHRIPLSYQVDNDTITNDPVGLSGIKLEVETLFITAFIHHTKAILKAFDEARVEAEELVASPLALSYSVLSLREKEIGALILDLGASTTSLITFEEGKPYSLEVIPWGSQHITNDIAMGFQISIDEAEKLKVNYGAVAREVPAGKKDDLVYGSYSKRKLAEIIEARLSDIVELAEKHLKKVDRIGLLPAGVVLVGGGANLPGVAELVRDALKLPTRVASPENLGGFKDNVKDSSWAAAVGIALMGIEQKEDSSVLHGKSGALLRWLRAFLP